MSQTVRFLCVDVGDADDAVAASAVTRAVALSPHWGRLLLFGRAANVAAQLDRQDRLEREEYWLEQGAAWLLADDVDGQVSAPVPPARPPPGPIEEAALVIGRSGHDVGALKVAESLVEIVGNLLVMAVANPTQVDAVDNAHLWVVGGTPLALQDLGGGRARCAVGGHLVGVTVSQRDVVVESWPLRGGDSTTRTLPLGGATKMSVRGGG